ncbi:MAG: hypothetical protein U0637_03780 [Phycisphaerales bacterium]
MNRFGQRTIATVAGCGLGLAALGFLQGQTQPTRPKDPLPSPRQPAKPATPPSQQPGQQPTQPVDPNQQPIDPNQDTSRYTGPFMFQSPQSQNNFNTRTQQLLRMEQQFETRRTDLMRRLGDARAMTGERKLDALADVLQQVILDQEQMHQYLVASRSAWTGDMTMDNQDANDPNRRMSNPNDNRNTQPGMNPRTTPGNPR